MNSMVLDLANNSATAIIARTAFLGILIWLSIIDLWIHRLPDRIVLPTLWAGLVLNAFCLLTTPADAVLGAAGGYLFLYLLSVIWSFRMVPGSGPAFGGGDLKAAAMIGAWIGASALPAALLIAFVAGTLAILPALTLRWVRPGQKIPFGPALAFGGGTVLFAGPAFIMALFSGSWLWL